jgi:acetoin utilization deacetylase AcuC-like enzyme
MDGSSSIITASIAGSESMHACLVRAAGGVTDLRTVEAGDGLEDLALAFGAGGVHHEHRHLRHGWCMQPLQDNLRAGLAGLAR